MTDLEMTLIGEILTEPEVFAQCISEISEQHFIDPSARRVFSECKHLFLNGEKIDPLSVLAKMGDAREEYKLYMANCVKAIVIRDIKKHIELLKEQGIKRMVCEDCSMLLAEAPVMSLSTMQELVAKMTTYFDRVNKDNTYKVERLATLFAEYMTKGDTSIKTDFPVLDKTLMINKGDYIVLGGRPSSGKTALSLQMAINMSKYVNVVYFSLETDPLKIWIRALSNYGDTELKGLKLKDITRENWANINNFQFKMSERGSFTIEHAAGYSVSQIKAKAMQLKADVVFIDYLTLIQSNARMLNQYEQATQISKDLHTMAQTESICVFALSQLNRESAKNDVPTMTDLRESGQIEQDADAILLLSNKTENEGDIHPRKLFIAKNKEGETGAISMDFVGSHQRFREVASRNL